MNKAVEPGLAVNDITVAYRNGHTALRHASFSIPRGTITALVGVNGSGKSTLFKAIMGFVPTSQGSVTISGPARQAGAQAQSRRLCAPERGCRLELPGAGRGRGDDGPLWPHEHAAHSQAGRSSNGHLGARARQSDRLSQAPDRRTVRRPEKARLPRPRPGPAKRSDPARRALYRRRCRHRGCHHRFAVGACATKAR